MTNLAIFAVAACLSSLAFACPDEKNCVSCPVPADGSPQICALCENSFYNVASKGCDTNISDSVDHCKYYSHLGDKVVCGTCDYGYFLDATTNKCVACSVDGCAICNTQNMCFGCFDKRRLNRDANSCDKDAKCDQLNCDICMSDNANVRCASCENGFAVTTPEEGKCVQATNNCYQIDTKDHARCVICSFGYYITKDGTCTSDGARGWWWLWLLLIPVAILIGFLVYRGVKGRQDSRDVYNTV